MDDLLYFCKACGDESFNQILCVRCQVISTLAKVMNPILECDTENCNNESFAVQCKSCQTRLVMEAEKSTNQCREGSSNGGTNGNTHPSGIDSCSNTESIQDSKSFDITRESSVDEMLQNFFKNGASNEPDRENRITSINPGNHNATPSASLGSDDDNPIPINNLAISTDSATNDYQFSNSDRFDTSNLTKPKENHETNNLPEEEKIQTAQGNYQVNWFTIEQPELYNLSTFIKNKDHYKTPINLFSKLEETHIIKLFEKKLPIHFDNYHLIPIVDQCLTINMQDIYFQDWELSSPTNSYTFDISIYASCMSNFSNSSSPDYNSLPNDSLQHSSEQWLTPDYNLDTNLLHSFREQLPINSLSPIDYLPSSNRYLIENSFHSDDMYTTAEDHFLPENLNSFISMSDEIQSSNSIDDPIPAANVIQNSHLEIFNNFMSENPASDNITNNQWTSYSNNETYNNRVSADTLNEFNLLQYDQDELEDSSNSSGSENYCPRASPISEDCSDELYFTI